MTALHDLTATRLREMLAAREVSAVEIARASLERIASAQPRVHALTEVTEELALKQAHATDAAIARDDALPPLAGIPVITKDNVDQEGARNTGGFNAEAPVASGDSAVVAAIRKAGASMVARSMVPAFSLRWFTDTDLHGRTLNPWNESLSPGGSSGGAGVAVATGMAPIAHGNDLGGSIRHPAHMNGVIGLRPTVGRVPIYSDGGTGGARALTSQLFTVDGPLARSVEDVALATNAMAARDPRDPLQMPAAPVRTDAELPSRAAVLPGDDLPGPISQALDATAQVLVEAGIAVSRAAPPHLKRAAEIWQSIVFADVRRSYLPLIEASGDAALRDNIASMLAITPELDGDAVLDLYVERHRIMREWSLFLAEHPIVVLPVSFDPALRVDADRDGPEACAALLHAQVPLTSTAMLALPGLAMPVPVAGQAHPGGVQIVSRWWAEDLALATGLVLEAAFPLRMPTAFAP